MQYIHEWLINEIPHLEQEDIRWLQLQQIPNLNNEDIGWLQFQHRQLLNHNMLESDEESNDNDDNDAFIDEAPINFYDQQ